MEKGKPKPKEADESAWMKKAAEKEEVATGKSVYGFLSSRWKVSLVAVLIGTIVVYFMSPPMIQNDKGKAELPKAAFWGAMAGVLSFVLPWMIPKAKAKPEGEAAGGASV